MVTLPRPAGRLLYVIGVPGCPIVKIGISDCPSARVRALRLVSDVTLAPASVDRAALVVLHQQSGGRALERALHRRFASRHVVGEWFDLGVLAVPLVRSAARDWQVGTSPHLVAS